VRARIAAPPVEGKANRELVRMLAGQLGVPPSSVRVIKGARARYKTIEVQGLTQEDLEERLRSLP
jgi:uncharacterized protein (TIGR00251 family)